MPFTFEQPWWLLLALLAVPSAWMALRWFATMSRVRALTAVAARVALLLLLAGALAGASAVQRSERLAVCAVIDISESVRTLADIGVDEQGNTVPATDVVRRWLERATQGRGADDLLGVVVFDGGPTAILAPTAGELRTVTLDHPSAQGTDIERAMRFASALFPPDARRRVLLISDGDQTEGDAMTAAGELAAAGVPVDVLPLPFRVERDVMVEAVDAPPQSAVGSTVPVRVVLRSTIATTGRLDLLYEDQPLDINGSAPGLGRAIALNPGLNVQTVQVPLRDGVVHRLEPVFTPDDPADDAVAANNRAQTFTVSPGTGTVLVVDGVSEDPSDPQGAGRVLSNALREAGLTVRTIGSGAFPTDLLSLQANDLVILQNVPAEEISPAQQTLLAEYVTRLGGGLVMVGGESSLGPGGWHGTKVEEVLPVRLDLPEQLVAPSAAIVLVLDSSGSMNRTVMGGSRTQMQIANEGAALAVRTLDKTDMVGVVAFSNDFRVVTPLERNTNSEATARRVRSISADGGTNLYPALAKAEEMLSGVEAGVKHVIALTDGQSMGDPSEGLAVAQRMRSKGITLTTIAVGDDADTQTLKELASAGSGQYHRVIDPQTLPRVFVKEVRVVRKPLIRVGDFAPVDLKSGSPLTTGLPGASGGAPFPLLSGVVLTRPKDDPKITYALATAEGEPLLAHWVVGRGQAAVFASDAHANWAGRWLDWPGYAAMWTRIARTIARPGVESGLDLDTQVVGDELQIRLDAVTPDGDPVDMLSVTATVYAPDGRESTIEMVQTGAGTYTGRAPATQRGNYIVAAFPRAGAPDGEGGRALAPVLGGATRATNAEFRRLQSDIALLERVAASTGGRVLSLSDPEGADLFAREGLNEVRASLPLWPVLLGWAVAVMLLDVGTRRVAWDRLITREVVDEVRTQAQKAVTERTRRAVETVERLRRASDEGERTESASGNSAAIAQAESQDRRDADARLRDARTTADAETVDELTRLRREKEERAREERRRRLREEMLRNLSGDEPQDGRPRAGGPAGAEREPPPGEPAPGEQTTSGLLEAKRRARARLDKPDEGSSG